MNKIENCAWILLVLIVLMLTSMVGAEIKEFNSLDKTNIILGGMNE